MIPHRNRVRLALAGQPATGHHASMTFDLSHIRPGAAVVVRRPPIPTSRVRAWRLALDSLQTEKRPEPKPGA